MRKHVPVAAILAVALAARLAFGLFVVGFDNPGKGDEADYAAIATSLVNGTGFSSDGAHPTAHRPPLFPWVLSGVFRTFGHSMAPARTMNALLGVVGVGLLFLLVHRRRGRATALVAAALAACNPFLVFISAYILTENLYIALWLLALIAAGAPAHTLDSWKRPALVGVLAGLATLARPTGLPVLAFVLAAFFVSSKAMLRHRVVHTAVAALACALVLAPWAARNARVFGGWVGLTTHGGITFYQGNNEKVIQVPHYRGGVAPLAALPNYERIVSVDERAGDQLAWRMGREFVRTHVRELPRLGWWKFARFWRLRSDVGMAGIKSGWWFSRTSVLGDLAARVDFPMAWSAVMFPLFVAGIWNVRRRVRDFADALALIVGHTAVALVFFGSLRSRVPIEPLIALFASLGLAAMWTMYRSKRGTPNSSRPRGETDTH